MSYHQWILVLISATDPESADSTSTEAAHCGHQLPQTFVRLVEQVKGLGNTCLARGRDPPRDLQGGALIPLNESRLIRRVYRTRKKLNQITSMDAADSCSPNEWRHRRDTGQTGPIDLLSRLFRSISSVRLLLTDTLDSHFQSASITRIRFKSI